MSRLGINNVRGLILVRGSSELPLPVNGDGNSINNDGKLRPDSSDLDESNCALSDLPRAAMAADCAPKAVSFPTIVHGQNRGFRWWGWSKNDEGELRIKIQVVMQPNSSEIDGN